MVDAGRAPSGQALVASPSSQQAVSTKGFDPSRSPRRTHDLILRIGADTEEDLAFGLRAIAADLLREGLSSWSVSGSPSVGWQFSYRHDPETTHDSYFSEIDDWLSASAIEARSDATPQSGAAGQGESAVGEAETPEPSPNDQQQ